MSAAVQTPPPIKKLMSAEEYATLPDDGRRTELVNGEVIDVPSPSSDHGYVCGNVVGELRNYVISRDLGRVVGNDSGVVTRRDPDGVRGLDAGYYSYATVPRGPRPKGYWPVPELVFEVRSPSDRTRASREKAREYLAAGVLVVCLVDPDTGTVEVHTTGGPVRLLGRDDALVLPELFPDFSVPVRAFLD